MESLVVFLNRASSFYTLGAKAHSSALLWVGSSLWVKGKKYICKGMFSYGKYICYGSTKLKEYFKTKDIEKYYNQGGLIWN